MSHSATKSNPSLSIVIATRDRAEPLHDCLASIARQSLLPEVVIVVDASEGHETLCVVRDYGPHAPFRLLHVLAEQNSAARQRNQGASHSTTDLLFFLDDDVVLDTEFISNIVEVFKQDIHNQVGGVGGTIVNEVYVPPSRLNSRLLRLCVGPTSGDYAGRLLGPALNFLPADIADPQQVDWLRSGCAAYRREIFMHFQFSESFHGYSFAEDVHLSARIGKHCKLLSTGRARLFHKNLGRQTHRDWAALGEMIVCNRHEIMTTVLQHCAFKDYGRFLLSEFVYGPAAFVWNGGKGGSMRQALLMTWGKCRGLMKVIGGRSPHKIAREQGEGR